MMKVGWGAEVREGDENPSPPNIYYCKEPDCCNNLRLHSKTIPPNLVCAGDAFKSLKDYSILCGKKTNICIPTNPP
jgi:hypothetical protein